MFPLLSLTACWPLRSTHFHGFLHYYEPVRLLACFLLPSSLLCAQGRIPSSEHVRSPGYTHCTLHARHALRPRRNLRILAFRLRIAACCVLNRIGFRSIYITRLNHFTLSHCGSHAPLSTLNPDLTALDPRLGTHCLPCFIGLGGSPNYTVRTEPAHS